MPVLNYIFTEEELKQYSPLVVKGKTPLWQHWEEFVRHYQREGKSDVTITKVRDTLKFIIKNLSILTIEDCNTPAILREAFFQAKEERNWANVTFNTYRKNLNTYFLWLLDMEYISENKLGKIRKCKEEVNEQYILEEEVVRELRMQLLNRKQNYQVERWRNLLFADLSILTGARPCELQDLRIIDVKRKKDKYVLEVKGHKQNTKIRRYDLPSSLRDTYDMYIYQRQRIGREEPYLFISMSKGTGWTYKGMNGLFQRLSKEMNVRITSYALRRFVATRLYKNGVALKHIMAHMGHTRLSTTIRYIENGSFKTDKGVEVMGEMF